MFSASKNKLQKGKIQANEVQLSSDFLDMILMVFINFSQKINPWNPQNQRRYKIHLCTCGFLNFPQNFKSLCSWGICQIQCLEMFLKGHGTFRTTLNNHKNSESRNHKKGSMWPPKSQKLEIENRKGQIDSQNHVNLIEYSWKQVYIDKV